MFKKITTLLICGLLGFSVGHAQDFEFVFPNPLYDTTSGVAVFNPVPQDSTHQYVDLRNFIKNTSLNSYSVTWRYIDIDTTVTPANEFSAKDKWFVAGICDNVNCRGEFLPWYYGGSELSAPVQPGSNMLISIHVYVPTSSPDTTRTYKVELKTLNQTDTAVYVVTKIHGLGISAIQLNDKRVSVYPNPLPAGQKMNLYIDKNLHAANAEVFNIIGQKLMTLPLTKGKELQSFQVDNLTAGMYIVKITNESDNVVTSRKFVKQ